jgi:hypothetical protein
VMNFPLAQKYAAIAAENQEFERGVIKLTATVGGRFEDVAAAFSQWVRTTPLPWPVALDYCLERSIKGKSLPFTING